MAFIRFVSMPPGEAPEDVRRAWVGVTVPATDRECRLIERAPVLGVLSGPSGFFPQLWALLRGRAERWRGYVIESRKCIEHLRERDSVAASWWVDNCPRFTEPRRYFCFPAECCEVVTLDRMPN